MTGKTIDKVKQGVTVRAIIIGLLLMVVNSLWIFESEIVRYKGHPTTISLFYSSVFFLVLLLIGNAIVRKISPKLVLRQPELLTIYIMLNIGACLVGHDSMQVLISLIPYVAYTATPENQWMENFGSDIPNWLVVSDKTAVKNFYNGNSSILNPDNHLPWVEPVIWWSAFVFVLFMMFLAINVLLRKQWTEREKLSYPLVQLPMDMTSEDGGLFKNKLLWVGFGIVAALDIVNGLATLYPSIPMIPIKNPNILAGVVLDRPFNYMGILPMQFYPFGVGLGMLLPLDLLFSCWFFFWFWKLERILTSALGYHTIVGMPYEGEQGLGAYIGICVFAIVVSRHHFGNLLRHFFGAKTDLDDKDEPISYKAAMWVIILGSAFLLYFSAHAGLSWYLAILFFLGYFAICIAITRMRAEMGLPAHDLHYVGPDRMIPTIIGPQNFSVRNLNMLSFYYAFNRAFRSHPMPFQLESFKIAERSNIKYKQIFWVLVVAGLVGIVVAWAVMLTRTYNEGAARMAAPNVPMLYGWEAWSRMDTWTEIETDPNHNMAIAIGVGFVTFLGLNSLRMWFPASPFHPVGYAVSATWSMQQLWMPMFLAWIIKLVILRYGGLRLYRRSVPFFLGVILAECVVGSFWTLWGILMDVNAYAFWP